MTAPLIDALNPPLRWAVLTATLSSSPTAANAMRRPWVHHYEGGTGRVSRRAADDDNRRGSAAGEPTPGAALVNLDGQGWDQLLRDVALGRLQLSIQTADGMRISLLAQDELDRLQTAAGERPPAQARDSLSHREREILNLVADGMTSGQVAQQLGLARNTVAQHLQSVRRKLGVNTTRAAAEFVRDTSASDAVAEG